MFAVHMQDHVCKSKCASRGSEQEVQITAEAEIYTDKDTSTGRVHDIMLLQLLAALISNL